ncbi:hypothetical protein [Methylorubrum extorquens]
MTYDEQVAHHEAAHVVISHMFGGGPTGHGIDIHAPSSVIGAFGNAGVATLIHDLSLPVEEQRKDLVRNVAIICAGAASDARTKGCSIDQAIQAQPSDLRFARDMIDNSTLIPTDSRSVDDLKRERDAVLKVGLETAEHHVARPEVWALVEKIARACIANGGKISREEIEDLL